MSQMETYLEDTIVAISTPIGEGAIAIIRISGRRAVEIAGAVVTTRSVGLEKFASHTIHLGVAHDNGTVLDQVMVALMRAPRTYTGEDIAEISCHGGLLSARRLLDLTLRKGARLAEPGEFTKRAFLNGHIDLTQAEAVIDIIRSGSDRALTTATLQLQGRLSARLEPARLGLVETLAHVEAHIDFPDEDIQTETAAQLAAKCGNVAETLKKLQATAREGKILREGVRVAIVGRPNVGKSSLMNALLGEDRAIVTPVPGTTRDTVEEVVNIRGLPMRLIDTAGLREGADAVEREGVRRSQQAIEAADVIVHVLDGSEILHQQDELIRNQLGGKAVICAVNKSDIAQTLDVSRLVDGKPVVVRTSALTGAGIEALKDALEELVWGGKVGLSQAEVTINSRHEAALMRALEALEKSRDGFLKQRNLEVIAVDLKTALDAVGEITGHTSTADILDKVFSAFCIGK